MKFHASTAHRCGFLFLLAAVWLAPELRAQISLTTAVDLALKNSPKVKMAADDVAKAEASLSETRDVFIPAVNVGAGLGNSYGYSPYPPTLFAFSAQSLVYNSSQFDYIRSAHAGLRAAQLSLQEARSGVAEDTVLTYASLDRDQRREAVLKEQSAYVDRLVSIVQDRLDAGRDTTIDLTTAKLSAAQLRLSLLHAEDETANDRGHLATLIGIPSSTLRVDGSFPPAPDILQPSISPTVLGSGVAAAFASAKAKQEQAWGDARFLYRPQVSLVVQYNRYASFTDSFKQIELSQKIGANEEVYAVQISIPLFDRVRQAKARETAADAAHAYHDADAMRANAIEGQSRLSRTIVELRARTEVASLEQQLARQQLDALLETLNVSSSNGPLMTPKDEQNSRIAEREKYLAVIDADYQLRQAEINLLRQTGQIEAWLRNAAKSRTVTVSSP